MAENKPHDAAARKFKQSMLRRLPQRKFLGE